MDGFKNLRAVCEDALSKVEFEDMENGTGTGHAKARAVDMAAVLCRHPQMLFISK